MDTVTRHAFVSTTPRFVLRQCRENSELWSVFDRHAGFDRTGTALRYDAETVAAGMEATEPPFTGRYVCQPLANGKVRVFDLMKFAPIGDYFADIAVECCEKLNATVSRPLFPVSTIAMPCSQCGANVIVAANVDTVKCRDCQRMVVDSALAELFATAKALRNGVAPFHVLTTDERAEQLTALIGDVDGLPDATVIELAGKCAERINARIPAKPEPDYVWDGESPDAATRDELESRIEVTGDDVPPVDGYFAELDRAVGIQGRVA